jgi:hypothetical protein
MRKYRGTMQITHEFLFERVREDPTGHLGGYSPKLLRAYFMGYDNARRFHGRSPIEGLLALNEFSKWFSDNVYGGREGFAAFCHLFADSEEKALELFFEFRELRLKEMEATPPAETVEPSGRTDDPDQEHISVTSLTLHETMRTKTALYFGNGSWLRGMWAMWSGYVWSERDMGIESSQDAQHFHNFQNWIKERYPFSSGTNWGKVMEFLGIGRDENAREQFYDHFELFLEGAPPDAQTKSMKEWIAACLADVKERQARGEL